MRKRRIALAMVLMLLALFVGCAGENKDLSVQNPPTVENIFTNPTEESSKNTEPVGTEPTSLETETTAPTETKPHSTGGGGSLGPSEKNPKTEEGFLLYEGDEMRLSFSIDVFGNMAEHGWGILLFVDGQIQPYKTEDDDTYRYMHTFYPEDGVELVKDLIFAPVTGTEGDVLEIWYTGIYWPEYSYLENGVEGFVLSSGSHGSGTQLKMEATPPALALPETPDRMRSSSISRVDLQSYEISGWTEQDMQEKCQFRMFVNGKSGRYLSGITEEEPVKLRFEVWGNPHVHYGLVFFVDNQPISVEPEDLLFFGVESGKKTVIEAELDMSGFDGESFVYAALIPRNKRSTEVLTYSWLELYREFTLFDVLPLGDMG